MEKKAGLFLMGVDFKRLKSFHHLLEQSEFLAGRICKWSDLIRQPSETKFSMNRVNIPLTGPGINVTSSIKLFVELEDVGRFRCPDHLIVYVESMNQIDMAYDWKIASWTNE